MSSLRYKTAPNCSLPGPLRHSGAGRKSGVAGPVRGYNPVFTYPCQPPPPEGRKSRPGALFPALFETGGKIRPGSIETGRPGGPGPAFPGPAGWPRLPPENRYTYSGTRPLKSRRIGACPMKLGRDVSRHDELDNWRNTHRYESIRASIWLFWTISETDPGLWDRLIGRVFPAGIRST